MTAPKSTDGETDPLGPRSPQPDGVVQSDAPSADITDTTGPSAEGSDENANPTNTDENTETKGTSEDANNTGTGGSATTTKSGTTARRRATTMKPPPTLLTDFLLGRPSAARIAADKKAAKEKIRQRRMSLEAVKQDMREAAVQRIQAPGGVRDRVTKWQKANAAAMARADPYAPPSEPSEVNVQVDEESVTEEDRVKIKMRQKKRPPLNVPIIGKSTGADESHGEEHKSPVHTSPPKKRVVSDTNWVKEHKSKGTQKDSESKTKQHEGGGTPLPKDFLSRPTPNLPVSKKIQEWASRVEIPEEPRKRSHTPRSLGSRSVGSGDGIRVRPVTITSELSNESDPTDGRHGTTHGSKTPAPHKPRATMDDGIRVKPLSINKADESGKRTKHQPKTPLDDGIRIRPGRSDSRDSSTVRAPSPPPTASRTASTSTANTPRRRSPSPRRETNENSRSAESKRPVKARGRTRTSTKKPAHSRPTRAKSMGETETTMTEDTYDKESWTSGSDSESDIPSSIPQKPLADIPFGYSAFSELELPRGRGARPAPKPKASRQTSFRGATNVLKRALNEGKKILAETVDPPKPVVNQPPSIENWLKDTVDPFVDRRDEDHDEPQKKSVEKEWAYESKTRRSDSSSRRVSADFERDEESHHKPSDRKHTSRASHDDLHDESVTASPSSGLRRSQATKRVSSPGRGATGRGLKEKIREAFRGESTVQLPGRSEYSSYDETMDDESDRTIEYQERPRPSGARRSPTPSDEEDSFVSTESSSLKPSPLNPKRRPPTNGAHELSTIISDAEIATALGSDLSSIVSETTVTQAPMTRRGTGLSRSTAVSRKRSSRSGLKRRLTKHSDLVSVLSLPDDSTTVSRNRSLRSAHSVRRASSHLHDATIENLLREFTRDENLYMRELKTLVDGVIPVLLSQFVHGKRDSSRDVFTSPGGTHKDDPLPKAVVSMGVCLEKLRTHHRRCPLADLHKLPQWLETVAPIYEHYLEVWRLGFQGVIVNLAPASPDDEDSLIDAMPRNEQGDILNEHGDRIDVAHLLKRPLVRTKWITKFIQVGPPHPPYQIFCN